MMFKQFIMGTSYTNFDTDNHSCPSTQIRAFYSSSTEGDL